MTDLVKSAGDVQPSDDHDALKTIIAEQVSSLSFAPVSTDIPLDKSRATKIPLDLLPSLGVGFASMPEVFRTISQAVPAAEGIFRLAHADGTPFAFSELQSFKNEAARMGSQYLGPGKGWEQARVFEVDSLTQTATIPYDPTTLAMAIALAQINQKLDGIQDTIDGIFEYLRIKDKAKLRESLETLSTILSDYKHNWDNKQFKEAKYLLAQNVNRDARQSIIELRAHLSKGLDKKGFVESRDQARKSSEKMLDMLKDYQLAIYLHSFSAFLCVMLLENYDEAYLAAKASDIRQKAFEYRKLYTECFDAIEKRGNESIDNIMTKGLSSALTGLGNVLAATPVGAHTPIDDALVGAGSSLGRFNEGQNRKMTECLLAAREPGVVPFAESIDSVNRIYNQPSQVLIDEDALYYLPVDRDE